MDIKKKLSSRENEILVEAVVQRLGPVLEAGNRVTTNFTNRVVALDKKVQQTNSNQINLQLDSQKNNKENNSIRRGLGRALRYEKFRRNVHRSQNIGLLADGSCFTKKDTATIVIP